MTVATGFGEAEPFRQAARQSRFSLTLTRPWIPFLPPLGWDTIGDMAREYVKKVEAVYRVGDTRVSLDSLVYLFREGVSTEGMVESYPALTLEQVHGALAFYLANQKEADAYLAEGQLLAAVQHEESRRANADLIAKIRRARHETPIPS